MKENLTNQISEYEKIIEEKERDFTEELKIIENLQKENQELIKKNSEQKRELEDKNRSCIFIEEKLKSETETNETNIAGLLQKISELEETVNEYALNEKDQIMVNLFFNGIRVY